VLTKACKLLILNDEMSKTFGKEFLYYKWPLDYNFKLDLFYGSEGKSIIKVNRTI